MHINDLERVLTDLGACEPAMTWLRSSGCKTFEEAWNACPRGSWLSWLIWHSVSNPHAGVEESIVRVIGERIENGKQEQSRYADFVRIHVPMADVEQALQARLETPPCR